MSVKSSEFGGLSDAMRRMEDTEAALRSARASATAVRQGESLPELVCRLVGEVAALQSQLVAMDAQLLDANPEIARLRSLIKDGCRAGEDYDDCPWCTFVLEVLPKGQRHRPSCPAFTPEGEVR